MTVSSEQLRALMLSIPSWARALPNIDDGTPFSDCDIDSLALLELVSEIQRVYGIEIPDDDIESVSSIANMAQYL
ncbi:MAG TPA: acyl carrier protein, partial [Rhizomicrobium sp.]|nr:acyl carrier protein [Rhizomicrobium sp.]